MMKPCKVPVFFSNALAACFLSAAALSQSFAQEAEQKPAAKAAGQKAEKGDKSDKAENQAQIELLETKVRFETNGDSRKEVHALVKIHSELGVRQFAQLNFDFNRSFESVEIPMVHVTHASGGTSDILPSAITDRPNLAVVNAPAYQDVRVKSVRILGLQPGDTLEYRVIRAVSHHPLAPDFWLDHSFDRSGVVSHEIFELDLPSSRNAEVRINPKTPAASTAKSGEGDASRTTYRWEQVGRVKNTENESPISDSTQEEPDVVATTFTWWPRLAVRLKRALTYDGVYPRAEFEAKAAQMVPSRGEDYEALYSFVSEKIRTIELPLGSTGFRVRSPLEVLSSEYGTAEDKAALFLALLPTILPPRHFALGTDASFLEKRLPRPSLFTKILAVLDGGSRRFYLDLATEVAPFGVVASNLRGKSVLMLNHPNRGFLTIDDPDLWREIPKELPFASSQGVNVEAALSGDGTLRAKVRYSMRGDNELVLRVAFHHTPKERWKEVAQLLSITDGFRGQVTGVNASDPYAIKEPFSVEYELEQPKFVDWSKKTVRIPALLPQLGLPDAPVKPTPGSATAPIELGTPLEVETHMTLQLPSGTNASAPTGTSVERDYATYTSQYSASASTITASRHIKFILREVSGARAADYNAFLRAVQSDEAQDFTIERSETSPSKTNPAAPNATTPPKTVPLRP